jgi:hypothetical protein
VLLFDPSNIFCQVLADLVLEAVCEKPRTITCPSELYPANRLDRSSTRVKSMLDKYNRYQFTAHMKMDYTKTCTLVLKFVLKFQSGIA